MTYADGSNYEGEWLDDLKHGLGELCMTNGEKIRGEWENDNIKIQYIDT